MLKCRSADRYQAVRPPRCNGGRPCDACRRKWLTAQLAEIEAALKQPQWRRRVEKIAVTHLHDGHLLAAMFNDSFGAH